MTHRYTYILECFDDSWYTGWAIDLRARISYHRMGYGAVYTKTHGVRKLVCAFAVADKSTAMKLEYAIKLLTKKKKRELVENAITNNPDKILGFDIIKVFSTESQEYDVT